MTCVRVRVHFSVTDKPLMVQILKMFSMHGQLPQISLPVRASVWLGMAPAGRLLSWLVLPDAPTLHRWSGHAESRSKNHSLSL